MPRIAHRNRRADPGDYGIFMIVPARSLFDQRRSNTIRDDAREAATADMDGCGSQDGPFVTQTGPRKATRTIALRL